MPITSKFQAVRLAAQMPPVYCHRYLQHSWVVSLHGGYSVGLACGVSMWCSLMVHAAIYIASAQVPVGGLPCAAQSGILSQDMHSW